MTGTIFFSNFLSLSVIRFQLVVCIEQQIYNCVFIFYDENFGPVRQCGNYNTFGAKLILICNELDKIIHLVVSIEISFRIEIDTPL